MIDVTIDNDNGVYSFHLHTPAAKDWVEENVALEGWQWLGSSCFAIDDGCMAMSLADGMTGDGLAVQ